MPSRSNPGRYERELVNVLDATGWVAMRAPSSGSATKRELPDIMALREDTTATVVDAESGVMRPTAEVLFVEHKSGSDSILYVDGDEADDLISAAHDAGARALFGARFKRKGVRKKTFLVEPRDARPTDGGNWALPQSTIRERAWAVARAETDSDPPEFERLK